MTTIEEHVRRRSGLLYPVLLVAAVVVIIFSLIGIAVVTGMLPGVPSLSEPIKTNMQRQDRLTPVNEQVIVTALRLGEYRI